MEDAVPPPALKKRATKRGLCKQVNTLPQDQPETQSEHVTDVYSSCVQRSTMFSMIKLSRRPLLTKLTDTNVSSDQSPVSDVPETPGFSRPKRKCRGKATRLIAEEPAESVTSIDDDLDDNKNSTIDDVSMTDDVSMIGSPLPPVPPPPPSQIPTRPRRFSRSIQKAFKAMALMKGELEKGQVSSPQAPPVDSPVQPSTTQVVRVRHIDDVHRFSMAKSEMFYSLQMQMATLLGARADQVGLFLNDNRLEPSDTPLSTCLHLADIIVCHILVRNEEEGKKEEVSGADDIRVQMQCQNSRQKASMVIKKFLPFKVMMEKYAQKQGRPVDKFQFHFDGEQLMPDTMPSDVDLDTDDTIDVVERN